MGRQTHEVSTRISGLNDDDLIGDVFLIKLVSLVSQQQVPLDCLIVSQWAVFYTAHCEKTVKKHWEKTVFLFFFIHYPDCRTEEAARGSGGKKLSWVLESNCLDLNLEITMTWIKEGTHRYMTKYVLKYMWYKFWVMWCYPRKRGKNKGRVISWLNMENSIKKAVWWGGGRYRKGKHKKVQIYSGYFTFVTSVQVIKERKEIKRKDMH